MPLETQAHPRPTARQAEYLAFIRAFTARWGIPPSFEEIGRHFMTTAPSVNSMVKSLEARGFLTRIPGAARTLRVVVPEDHVAVGRSDTRRGSLADPRVDVAMQTANLIVERLVPALKGVDRAVLGRALDAAAAALDVACSAAGASSERREAARGSLVPTAQLAQGTSPELRPGRRRVRRSATR
jgi:hypothetical protein